MIYTLLQQLQALGLNVPEILKQLGTNADGEKEREQIAPVQPAARGDEGAPTSKTRS